MKKLLAFILVFMMMFSIAACGGKTDKQSDGGTSDKGGESAISNLGFENADDAQRFVENFNSSTDGYAYMVESDAESFEGTGLFGLPYSYLERQGCGEQEGYPGRF